jgi:hypothetical protein
MNRLVYQLPHDILTTAGLAETFWKLTREPVPLIKLHSAKQILGIFHGNFKLKSQDYQH